MLVATVGVNDRIADNKSFAKHVIKALGKFNAKDWGNSCDEDIKANDQAILDKTRILASYGQGEDKIWIIKDAGKGASVTILFPSEY